MAVKEKIKSHLHVVDHFKELPFYDKQIEKPRVKCLKNVDLLSILSFYEELNVIKTNHAFRRYALSYKVKLVEKKGPTEQLESSKSSKVNQAIKSSIKDLFNNLKQKILSIN